MDAAVSQLLAAIQGPLQRMAESSILTALRRVNAPLIVPASVAAVVYNASPTEATVTVTVDDVTASTVIQVVSLVGIPRLGDRVMVEIRPDGAAFMVGWAPSAGPFGLPNAVTGQATNAGPNTVACDNARHDWPIASGILFTHTKRHQLTDILVTVQMSAYVDVANVLINSYVLMDSVTATLITFHMVNAANDHRHWSGTHRISGIASGDHTWKLQVLANAFANMKNDGNDIAHLTVEEVIAF